MKKLHDEHQKKLYQLAQKLEFHETRAAGNIVFVLKAAAQMIVFCAMDCELTADMLWPKEMFSMDVVVRQLMALNEELDENTVSKCERRPLFLVPDYKTDPDFQQRKTLFSLLDITSIPMFMGCDNYPGLKPPIQVSVNTVFTK